MHWLDATPFIRASSLSHFHPALHVIHILQPKKLRLSSTASFTKHLAVVSRAVDNGQVASYTSLEGEKNQCGLMGQSWARSSAKGKCKEQVLGQVRMSVSSI